MSMMKMFAAVTLTAAALAALTPTDASARSFAAVTHVGQSSHGTGSVGWRRSTRSSRYLLGARLRAIHARYRRKWWWRRRSAWRTLRGQRAA